MGKQIIEKEIIVNAALEEVWNRWTTEEGIRALFAQDCKLDFQVGGKLVRNKAMTY